MEKTLEIPSEYGQLERQGSFLPILVLYNLRLSDSPTYRAFLASVTHGFADPAQLAVYDNSAVRQVTSGEENRLHAYQHDPANGGLAAAYNWGLSIATELGRNWLLLLDQDSELSPDFLAEVREAALQYGVDEQVAAIVPRVRDGAETISPSRVKFGRLTSVPEALTGISHEEVKAINSGSLVRVQFLNSMSGFNRAFPLDSLDHWLFHEIYARGKVAAVSSSYLRHDLSVRDYRNKVSVSRYRSILSSEARFVIAYKQGLAIPLYLIRLVLRAAKQLLCYRRRDIARTTVRTAIGIVLHMLGLRVPQMDASGQEAFVSPPNACPSKYPHHGSGDGEHASLP